MSRATFEQQLAALRSHNLSRFYILLLLFGVCTLFYYFGELVDLAGWKILRWDFFYSVHDIQRLLFLAPIIYAGYVFELRVTAIIIIVAIMTFLPRALFISPFPDPLLRTIIFIILASINGYLTAKARSEARNESGQRRQLEVQVSNQREVMLRILENIVDGVLIIGPDYTIRFINPSMLRNFGEGAGSYCYKYLLSYDAPCGQSCKLPEVINGAVERWEYNFSDGRTYEVLASPYIDSDGVVCQLAVFRNTTPYQV